MTDNEVVLGLILPEEETKCNIDFYLDLDERIVRNLILQPEAVGDAVDYFLYLAECVGVKGDKDDRTRGKRVTGNGTSSPSSIVDVAEESARLI